MSRSNLIDYPTGLPSWIVHHTQDGKQKADTGCATACKAASPGAGAAVKARRAEAVPPGFHLPGSRPSGL